MPKQERVDHARVLQLLAKGLKAAQVSRRLGCSESRVRVIAKEGGR